MSNKTPSNLEYAFSDIQAISDLVSAYVNTPYNKDSQAAPFGNCTLALAREGEELPVIINADTNKNNLKDALVEIAKSGKLGICRVKNPTADRTGITAAAFVESDGELDAVISFSTIDTDNKPTSKKMSAYMFPYLLAVKLLKNGAKLIYSDEDIFPRDTPKYTNMTNALAMNVIEAPAMGAIEQNRMVGQALLSIGNYLYRIVDKYNVDYAQRSFSIINHARNALTLIAKDGELTDREFAIMNKAGDMWNRIASDSLFSFAYQSYKIYEQTKDLYRDEYVLSQKLCEVAELLTHADEPKNFRDALYEHEDRVIDISNKSWSQLASDADDISEGSITCETVNDLYDTSVAQQIAAVLDGVPYADVSA